MKTNLLLAIALLISSSILARSWTLDKAHVKLGFTVTHLMVSDVEGKFKNFRPQKIISQTQQLN
jgi:polyisoprenoid-binding protein YceI